MPILHPVGRKTLTDTQAVRRWAVCIGAVWFLLAPQTAEATQETLVAYGASETLWADPTAPNTKVVDLGWFSPGTTIRVGTCDALDGAAWPPDKTFFRLLDADRTTLTVSWYQCADHGAIIDYTVPWSTQGLVQKLSLAIGCTGLDACLGLVKLSIDFDSNGVLQDPVAAFRQLISRPSTGGCFYSTNAGLSAVHPHDGHFQGIARLRTPWFGIAGLAGNSIAVSSNDPARLHFASLHSQPILYASRWGSGCDDGYDKIVGQLTLSACATSPPLPDCTNGRRWETHAGGIQAIGHYTVVGLENNKASRSGLADSAVFSSITVTRAILAYSTRCHESIKVRPARSRSRGTERSL